MPWRVARSDSCPDSKPWAVVNESSGETEGCHETEEMANRQRRALYANTDEGATSDMQHKDFPAQTKALDDEAGTFEALASVFENVDLVGDRVKQGAFSKSLERWREKGDPIPIILSHDWSNPWSHIGVAQPEDVKETDEGLLVKGTLDIESNEVAAQVYRLMKRRSLTGWSFGYSTNEETTAKDGANELIDLDLFEAGPTLRGANPEAQLQAVKSAVEAELEPDDEPETSSVKDGADKEPSATSRPHDPVRATIDRVLLGDDS